MNNKLIAVLSCVVFANVQVLADVRNGDFEADRLKNEIGDFSFSHGSGKKQTAISGWTWTGGLSPIGAGSPPDYFAYQKDELKKLGVADVDGNAVMITNPSANNPGFLYQDFKVIPGQDLILNFSSVGAIQYVVQSTKDSLDNLKSLDGKEHNNIVSYDFPKGTSEEEINQTVYGSVLKNQLVIKGENIKEDTLRLKFTSTEEYRGGIDNVSVKQVPEPSSTMLLGLGLSSLLLRRRR